MFSIAESGLLRIAYGVEGPPAAGLGLSLGSASCCASNVACAKRPLFGRLGVTMCGLFVSAVTLLLCFCGANLGAITAGAGGDGTG